MSCLCGADSLYMSIMYDIYRPILPPADQEQILTRGDSEFFLSYMTLSVPTVPWIRRHSLKLTKAFINYATFRLNIAHRNQATRG